MNFIRDEKGQGLVEYALILVLVAIVVIVAQLLLGPIIEICSEFCPVNNVNTPQNTPVEINYFSNNIALPGPDLQIESEPDHGSAVITPIAGGGPSYIVTYTPQSGFSGVDSFGVARCSSFQAMCESITQQVTVGPAAGASNTVAADFSQAQVQQPGITKVELVETPLSPDIDNQDEIYTQLFDFLERVNQQTNSINTARELMTTAFESITGIVNTYAVDNGNLVLQDGMADLVLAVESGDETAVTTTVTNIAGELAAVPSEVQTAILIEGGPLIVDAHHALYGIDVDPAGFTAVHQLWLEQEENEPGSTAELIPWLVALWADVEQRNQALAIIQPYLAEGASLSINALFTSGDEENIALAQQLNDDYHWGLLDEAIAKADIDNEGIRNSLVAKRNSARSAYDAGNLVKSGKKLCNLQHFVDEQENQHIVPHSAAIIRDSLVEISNGLEIPMNCLAE